MFGHMSYFTSPSQPRNEQRFNRARPEEHASLWGPSGRQQRTFGKR